MTRRRIGGLLLVAGSVGFGLKVLSALADSWTTLRTALLAVPSAIYIGSMVLLALGAAIVAITWPPLRAAGLARAGLALFTVGLLGLAYLEANPLPLNTDPMGYPILVWPLYLCYPLGQILLGIALVRERGLSRVVGALLIVVLFAVVGFRDAQAHPAGPEVTPSFGAAIGLLAVSVGTVLGWAGLGLLVFRGAVGRTTPSHLRG
jgi:hypothetical protein